MTNRTYHLCVIHRSSSSGLPILVVVVTVGAVAVVVTVFWRRCSFFCEFSLILEATLAVDCIVVGTGVPATPRSLTAISTSNITITIAVASIAHKVVGVRLLGVHCIAVTQVLQLAHIPATAPAPALTVTAPKAKVAAYECWYIWIIAILLEEIFCCDKRRSSSS